MCLANDSFESRMSPRCLWWSTLLTWLFWKSSGGWTVLDIFDEKIISSAALVGSGLKVIFYWWAQEEMTFRSLFKSVALDRGLWTIEKRDTSSAKNLTLLIMPVSRSLTKIKNSRGPSTDPWGTPERIGAQLEFWPLITTCWIRFVR